jgi:uncharacterized MAPEG superfamily protein
MIYIPLVTCIMLIQLFAFSLRTGMARDKGGVKAPATSGDETYERRNRVHLNTLELIVMAIPSMWIFATYVHALTAAGLGFVYVIGRIIYSRAYMADPSKRGLGFMISILPTIIMMIGGLMGVIYTLVKTA